MLHSRQHAVQATQFLMKNKFPVVYPGFQRGGCLRSGPIRKVGGGGGGGGGGGHSASSGKVVFTTVAILYCK